MDSLPYVRVVRSEIAGVQLGVVFCFNAAPDLLPSALEVAQSLFRGPNFKPAYIARDTELWIDYSGVDLDIKMVDGLIGQMAQEIGFTIIEPVPLEIVPDYLNEAMRPHLPR